MEIHLKARKARYEVLAKLEKAWYKEEMINYMGKKRKRRKKEAKTSQKSPSSFFLFSLDYHTKLKQKNLK